MFPCRDAEAVKYSSGGQRVLVKLSATEESYGQVDCGERWRAAQLDPARY